MTWPKKLRLKRSPFFLVHWAGFDGTGPRDSGAKLVLFVNVTLLWMWSSWSCWTDCSDLAFHTCDVPYRSRAVTTLATKICRDDPHGHCSNVAIYVVSTLNQCTKVSRSTWIRFSWETWDQTSVRNCPYNKWFGSNANLAVCSQCQNQDKIIASHAHKTWKLQTSEDLVCEV